MEKYIDVDLIVDMANLRKRYLNTLGMIRYGVSNEVKLSEREIESIKWHSRADEEFLEQWMMESVRRAGRRLLAWGARTAVGWPQSRIRVGLPESYKGFEEILQQSVERYVLLTAEAEKLGMHDASVGDVLRPLVERREREAARELDSLVETMVLCENCA